ISEASALVLKWLVEKSIERECASAEGRFSAELLKNKLLNGVVEQSPTSPDASLTRSSRAPSYSDSGRERLVVRLRQGVWYARISWDDQAGWDRSSVVAVGIRDSNTILPIGDADTQLTRINRRNLTRPKCLYPLADVSNRGVEFPTQSVIEC